MEKRRQLLPGNVIQFHSSEYKNPLQLSPGTTLVVGGGNSGAQIAAEIALHAKQSVAISTSGKIKYKPLYIMKRSIFWYFEKLGIIRAGADTLRGAWLRKQPEYVYGYDLKKLVHEGKVHVLPWQTARGSALIGWVKYDAERVVSHIISTY